MKIQIRFNIILLLILAVTGIGAIYGSIRDSSAASKYMIYPTEPRYSYYLVTQTDEYFMIRENIGKGVPAFSDLYAVPKSDCSLSPVNRIFSTQVKLYSDDEIYRTQDNVKIHGYECVQLTNVKKIVTDLYSIFEYALIICIFLFIAGNIIISLIRLTAHLFRKNKE